MTTLLAFIATLALLIVFHELGHYLAARLTGVKVLRFSVGFGRVIASRRDSRGTQWALSAIPLGGYVKMLDEREGEVATADLPRAFNRQSLGARAFIVAAGPLANFLLAILLLWGLFVAGVPATRAVLGTPPAHSAAAQAGILAGETVQRVNNVAIESWQDLHWVVLKFALRGENLRLETVNESRHVAERVIVPDLSHEALEQAPLKSLGLVHYLPPLAPVLGELSPQGAAARAGFKPNDRILSVDGKDIQHWEELVSMVRAAPERTLAVVLQRGDSTINLPLRPDAVPAEPQPIGRIGAAPFIDPEVLATLRTEVSYAPMEALQRAMQRTWDLSAFSLEMLGRMVMGQASLKNISGPISIADYAGQSAQNGLASYVGFLALVSISLGVLNLLPVPLLDGGHLLYYSAEFLTGRPVPDRIQEYGQRIGMGLLAMLMFLAIFNDLTRIFAG